MLSNPLVLDGYNLTIDKLISITRGNRKVEISDEARKRIIKAREVIEKKLKEGAIIYGVTTGFGKLANTSISPDEREQLQLNLIRSHSIGFGDYIPDEVVLGAMVIELNSFCKGASGISLETVEIIKALVNNRVIPLVPDTGSVGASGDLSPLAYIASVLVGEGKAKFKGEILTAAEVLKKMGLKPLKLKAKEGLALINGTHVLTSYAAHAIYNAENLIKHSTLALSITLEAFHGNGDAFLDFLMELRPHNGQKLFAQAVKKIITGSTIVKPPFKRVQDPYSLRCSPQVHGAIIDTLNYCKSVVEVELNSVSDNPLINIKEEKVASGGNFHGEPIALVMDFLSIALAELSSITERRINLLLDSNLSGLPSFLTEKPGLNSGLMILQYAVAALLSENKILAHPASVDNTSVSANQEDHVSMGLTASKKAYKITNNLVPIIAAEIYTAFQALEFEKKLKPSDVVVRVKEYLKQYIKPVLIDNRYDKYVSWIAEQIRNKALIKLVEDEVGNLW